MPKQTLALAMFLFSQGCIASAESHTLRNDVGNFSVLVPFNLLETGAIGTIEVGTFVDNLGERRIDQNTARITSCTPPYIPLEPYYCICLGKDIIAPELRIIGAQFDENYSLGSLKAPRVFMQPMGPLGEPMTLEQFNNEK